MQLSQARSFQCLLALIVLFYSTISIAGEIIKSPNDNREYRSITLKNGLQALLISDPQADKAAASLDVGVGSNANPDERLGLAHFLEHMLFLGTKKYPEAGEYQAFIQSHGGNHNAFTANHTTNYYFDIDSSHLAPALDRFSQFFIAPLFEEKYTDRERHAVHSEYSSKIRDDGRRAYAVTKQVMNPDHPGNRFAVGSLETLSNEPAGALRKDMIAFYNTHYSANLMKLVVLGKEPLAELKQWVTRYFSAIPDRALPPFEVKVLTYRASDLPMEVLTEPVKDIRQLSMTFPLPPSKASWTNKPAQLITGIIGYEGDGSLIAYLKEQGWATGLGAYSDSSSEVETLLTTSISLTKEGLQHRDDVVAAFFSFMRAFQATGLSQSLFDEEQTLAVNDFRFLAKQEPIHYVSQLSQQMRDYPERHWIDAPYRLEALDQVQISQLLSSITPANMVLKVQAKGLETNQTEPHFKAPFAKQKISADRIAMWQAADTQTALYARHNNPFVPSNLDIAELGSQKVPTELENTPHVESWYLPDTTFKLPKADLYFTLLSPFSRAGAKASVAMDLYVDMLNEQLNPVLYDAAIAGLSANIYAHSRGITVRISGYSDKVGALIDTIAAAMRHPTLPAKRFNVVKQSYLDDLQNAAKDKPFQQLFRVGYETLLNNPALTELNTAAQDITLKDIQAVPDVLFATPFARLFTHGNLTAEQTEQIARKIAETLQLENTASTPLEIAVKRLDTQALTKAVPVEHNDTALALYLQGSSTDIAERAQTALLAEILSAPFYSELRTEQQLGYIVFASPMSLRDLPGLSFVVQSPTASAELIETRINAFLERQSAALQALTRDDLERFKNSLISRLTTEDKNRKERTNRFWQLLDKTNIDFADRDKLVAAIKQLDNAKLIKALESLQQRRLTLSTMQPPE